MRVLQVIPSLRPESGGPSRSLPQLCRALVQTGVDVTLFTTCLPGESLTIDPTREPYEVELFSSRAGINGAALKIFAAIKSRSREFELVHIHSVWNPVATLAAAASRSRRLSYVLAPHGMLDNICLLRHPLRKRIYSALLERLTIEKAARLHFMSEHESGSSRNGQFRYPEHFVSTNGVDISPGYVETGAFRRRYAELRDKQIMLFFGRLHPIKGLDLQLQALGCLAQKHPSLTWVLAGPDAGEWQRISRLVKATGLGARVKWIGLISEPERFSVLADADVVVQTSFYESHSMTINEALAVGVPLVVTDTVHREDVERYGAGYCVRREAAAVAGAIDKILRSADRRESMRRSGRRYAAEKLAWPQIARALKSAYDEIASVNKQRAQIQTVSN
jgi:glycosyltransferase involved in cell wall biosynthesis